MGKKIIIPGADFSKNAIPSGYMVYGTPSPQSYVINVTSWDDSNVPTSGTRKNIVVSQDDYSFISLGITNAETISSLCFQRLPLKSIEIRNNLSLSGRQTAMFYLCSSLKSVDLGSLDLTNVASCTHMFAKCGQLTDIYLPKDGFNACQYFSSMFQECVSLRKVVIPQISLPENFTCVFNRMFIWCSAEEITFEGLSITFSAATYSQMFWESNNIAKVNVGSLTNEAKQFLVKALAGSNFFFPVNSGEWGSIETLTKVSGWSVTAGEIPGTATEYDSANSYNSGDVVYINSITGYYFTKS